MRKVNWSIELDQAITAARLKQFSYGTFDCALFAADCVLAMTGIDYASTLRGYEGKFAAARVIAQYGSIEEMLTALLSTPPAHRSTAHRGDVIVANIPVANGEHGAAIGICIGPVFLVPTETGLVSFPMKRATLTWRIA